MRKRIFFLIITLSVLFSLFPVRALACGGFVALKGEKVYHSIYCTLVDGCSFSDLRWYDTSKQAESAGLKPCDECSEYSDWSFSCDYYEPHWWTEDRLLWTAMEMEFDLGIEIGNENGYADGFSNGQTGYEYSMKDYYELGYDEGYENGKNNGYDSGYDDGVSAGKEKASKELRKEIEEEYNLNAAESIKNARMETAVICAIVFGVILYLTKKKKES